MVKLISFLTMGLAFNMAARAERPKYRDPSASVEERVSDLLSRMTVEEKTAQLIQGMIILFGIFTILMKQTEEG